MPEILLLGLISVVTGFIGSLTGLGGASILIPLLVLLRVPVKVAIASSMVSIIATSAGSASAFVRDRLTNVRIAMYLEMFTMTGAIIGATITTVIPAVFLYFFFALFLLTSFINIGKYREFIPDVQPQDRVSKALRLDGSYYDEAANRLIEYKGTNALLGGAGMIVAGLAAGMLGIGAGAFKVTVQENILRLPPKVASTTSSFIIGMTALAAASVYLFSGLLNLTIMVPVAVGTTIGALVGGRVLNRLNDRVLQYMFYIIVIYIVGQMLFQGIMAA